MWFIIEAKPYEKKKESLKDFLQTDGKDYLLKDIHLLLINNSYWSRLKGYGRA